MEQQRVNAAHIRTEESTGEISAVQTIAGHSEAVAKLASAFAEPFGAGSLGYLAGLFHDYGKYAPAFQSRIWDNGGKVDHSTPGAYEVLRKSSGLTTTPISSKEVLSLLSKNKAVLPVVYSIAGHHAGLPDGGDISCAAGTLSGRIYGWKQKKMPIAEEISYPQISWPPLTATPAHMGFCLSFFTRMLFSCLVDADFLDTEAFMQPVKANRRKANTSSMSDLLDRLMQHIEKMGFLDGREGMNQIRSQILADCIHAGKEQTAGLKTLTVPTGGGKTIASLAFALNQAVKHGMDRIIYVIPYCSIIDQTVDVFEQILGMENVLAHYSEANYVDKDEMSDMKRLASENWDLPVIVTTSVQFFESLFASRTSACRKLHSISNSVVIFDEAQTLPLPYLMPCVHAISELVLNYHATCVLCTATQPALDSLFSKYLPDLQPTEICPRAMIPQDIFRRVTYINEGVLEDAALAEQLNKRAQVLCIVRSRRQAKAVYNLLHNEEGCYHLSTLMAPIDRKVSIDEIRERLRNGMPCRVVSTSLIEAGVDLDFPEVYRALTGLDSIIQAAGRCNREGKRSVAESIVHLFEPESTYKIPDPLRLPKEVAERVTHDNISQPDDPTVIRSYFQQLYLFQGDQALDKKEISKRMEADSRRGLFPFSSVSRDFHLIEQDTWSIVIPLDELSQKLCTILQNEEHPLSKEDYRILGNYTVQVYPEQFMALQGSLFVTDERRAVLCSPILYDPRTGLAFQDAGGNGLFY